MNSSTILSDNVIGLSVDIKDISGCWTAGTIINVNSIEQKVQIEYVLLNNKCTEWLETNSKRIVNFGTKTYQPDENSILWTGNRIEVCDQYDQWYESEVIDVSIDKIKIHYFGRVTKYDEWIFRNSKRIRKHNHNTSTLT
jgi:hypothetical protein